jgi:Streptogramin lyase
MATYIVPEYRARVSTYAGKAGVSGLVNAQVFEARMKYPYGLAYDSAGNLYFSDQGNHSIRKIDTSGNITTFAGSGISGSTDGQGLSASFNNPYGIVFDQADNLYVVDNLNKKIRKIDPSGYVSTFAGNGTASLIDGKGTDASFNEPTNIAIDSSGNLYVSEYGSSSIRKITPDANVTTFAGTGSRGSNNGQGTSASFDRPYGLVFDSSSNLYVGDYGNHVIRKIDPSGNVTTFAGIMDSSGFSDGQGTSASFYGPVGLTIDPQGNLYVTDQRNHSIRKIDPSRKVITIAGTGSEGAAEE